MDNTQVLQAVGGDGLFQVCLIVATEIIRLSGFWTVFFFNFGNYEPPWRCLDWKPNVSLNLGQDGGWNWNKTNDVISPNNPDSCDMYESCSKIEFEHGSSTFMTEWGLMCDKQWIATFLVTAQMVVSFVGSMMGGQISERFGRKFVVYFSTALHGMFVFFSIFASSWECFLVLKFLAGFCYGVMFSVCLIYSMEFLGPAGLSVLTFSVGVFFTRSWKSYTFITFGLIVLACASGLVMPESMRWLYVQGKLDKCKAVARKVSRWNRQKRFPQINFTKFGEDMKSKATYLDLFRTHQLRVVTFGINYLFFVRYFVYFMLGLETQAMSGDFYTNTLLYSLFEVPVVVLALPVVRWMGNRKSLTALFSISCACMLVAVVLRYVMFDDPTGLTMITYFGMFAKLSLSGSNQILGVYTGEVYPTTLRTLGFGLSMSTSSIGTIIAPFLIPSRSVAISVGFPVSAALLLLSCVTLYFMPETKNKALEDFQRNETYTETSHIVVEQTNLS